MKTKKPKPELPKNDRDLAIYEYGRRMGREELQREILDLLGAFEHLACQEDHL